VLNLLTSPRTVRTVRGLIGTIADAVRSTINPAALVADQAEAPAVVEAPDPAGLYAADEMPTVEAIEAAAADYDEAADQARAADRAKRKARKLLDRLPAGRYGAWLIRRVESSRETPDLVAIRATYERLGLGDVPMRKVAPSLKVERVEVLADTELLAGVAA
jgi:hypothetical protein